MAHAKRTQHRKRHEHMCINMASCHSKQQLHQHRNARQNVSRPCGCASYAIRCLQAHLRQSCRHTETAVFWHQIFEIVAVALKKGKGATAYFQPTISNCTDSSARYGFSDHINCLSLHRPLDSCTSVCQSRGAFTFALCNSPARAWEAPAAQPRANTTQATQIFSSRSLDKAIIPRGLRAARRTRWQKLRSS